MAEKIDDISIEYRDPATNQTLVQQLAAVPLTRGAWTTIMFKYRERTSPEADFGAIKYRVGRYRKRNGQFQQQSKFNISSVDQAKLVVEILNQWIAEDQDAPASEPA